MSFRNVKHDCGPSHHGVSTGTVANKLQGCVCSCPVSLIGQHLIRKLGSKSQPLSCAHNDSSFTAGDKRMSVMLNATPTVAEWAKELAVRCHQYLQENDVCKGKTLAYNPLLRESIGLRCKLTAPSGGNACTFWDENCQGMEMPEEFSQVSVAPKVVLKHR